MLKNEILESIIAALPQHAIVIETGRMRHAPGVVNDGLSTKVFADSPNVDRVYSIDHFIPTEEVVRKSLCADSLSKVSFINKASLAALQELTHLIRPGIVRLLFLDSANDAQLILDELKTAYPLVALAGLIVIDDVFCKDGVKGALALPYLAQLGWRMRVVGPYAVFRRPVDAETD